MKSARTVFGRLARGSLLTAVIGLLASTAINTLLVAPKNYGTLQGFYQAARQSADAEVVFSVPADAGVRTATTGT